MTSEQDLSQNKIMEKESSISCVGENKCDESESKTTTTTTHKKLVMSV